MLIISNKQRYDLNYAGIACAILIAVFVLFYNIQLLFILLIEIFLFVTIYALYKKIKINQSMTIIINPQNKWFVKQDGQLSAVEVKDYWLHTKRLFIWLKGSNNSMSIVVTRSIIGAENFSLLRTKII